MVSKRKANIPQITKIVFILVICFAIKMKILTVFEHEI